MSAGFSERRGAHRPASVGPTSAIPWLVAAVAIIVIVGFASGWFGGSNAPSSNTVTAGSSSTAKSTATSSPTSTAKGSPTSTATASPAATADRTLAVSVLNSTSTSGLAARAADRLKTAGWTIRSTGNYRGGVAATTVFYGKASLKATAQAVAADLGTTAVSESADFGASRVTVVLAGDFRP
ncbi:MAG TPA: LytR C-terminal domain-containing protein [Angustibacter sp.]|nr:LytR C-terminal domain-containing protein [Angustibacter sp.]